MLHWLDHHTHSFPPLSQACQEPNGLLCAGGDLSPERIIAAYQQGIFPWFSEEQPILWWSPDPRMVLLPSEFKISRSLRRTLRAGAYQIRLDSHFDQTIQACANTPRAEQNGSWITHAMQRAYQQLFKLGIAHSVETWAQDKLVGGLYGLAIGRMFYGESMFSLQTDASKIALAHLTRFLQQQGFGLIDCQMHTPHLASLGARTMPRQQFIEQVKQLTQATQQNNAPWSEHAASGAWIS